MKGAIFLLAIAWLAAASGGCSGGRHTANLDIALTDGTHVQGRLVAVDTDWIVLDQIPGETDLPLMLLDYGLIDTVTIPGRDLQVPGATLGGLVGAVSGLFISSGWTFDSTTIAKHPTRSILGFTAGLLAGAAAGYLVGSAYTDSTLIFSQPDSMDYVYLRTRARYPDTIPHWLRQEIDTASLVGASAGE